MPSFVLESVLKLRDDLSGPVTNVFQRVENLGDRAARRFGKSLKKRLGKALRETFTLGKLAKTGAVLGGTAAAGVGVMAHQLNELANGLANVARAAEAQDLDATFLAALVNQAEAQGVENAFDGISRASEEFLLRLTELQQKDPTGELFSNLKDIGAKGLIDQFKNTTNATDALRLALSAIAVEKDQAKKIRLADSIFGGSDQALDLRRLASDAGALQQLFANQERLAGATEKQFHAAKQLDDKKKQLRATVRNLATQLSAGLVPAFDDLATQAQGWVTANRELIDQKIGALIAFLSDKLQALLRQPWGEWLERAAKAARETLSAIQTLGRVLVLVAENATTVGAALFAVWSVAKLAALARGIASLGKAAAGVVPKLAELGSSAVNLGSKGTAQLGKFSAGVKALTSASMLAAVGGLAYQLGKALDDALGLSDAIANALSGVDGGGTTPKAGESIEDARIREAERLINKLEEEKRSIVATPEFIGGPHDKKRLKEIDETLRADRLGLDVLKRRRAAGKGISALERAGVDTGDLDGAGRAAAAQARQQLGARASSEEVTRLQREMVQLMRRNAEAAERSRAAQQELLDAFNGAKTTVGAR